MTMVEWVESRRVSLSLTPVEVAVRVKFGLVVKQVPRGEKIGVLLNTVPHLSEIKTRPAFNNVMPKNWYFFLD